MKSLLGLFLFIFWIPAALITFAGWDRFGWMVFDVTTVFRIPIGSEDFGIAVFGTLVTSYVITIPAFLVYLLFYSKKH